MSSHPLEADTHLGEMYDLEAHDDQHGAGKEYLKVAEDFLSLTGTTPRSRATEAITEW